MMFLLAPARCRGRFLNRFGWAVCALIAFALAVAARAQAGDSSTGLGAAITNPGQLWELPFDQKSAVHPLRIEGRVSYVDRSWRQCWLEDKGVGYYLPLAPSLPPLQQGQRVFIEGTIIPAKGLEGARVTVKVLQDFEPIEPLNASGRIVDMTTFQSRIVTVEGYVDSQQVHNDEHLGVSMIVGDQPVTAWVKPADPRAVPNWQGKFVRITGLYQARFDPTGTKLTVELWTARQTDVVVVGSMDDSGRFAIATTPINRIYQAAPGSQLKIRGVVQGGERGASLILRDDTGQVTVQSVQQERKPVGTVVEAVGEASLAGGRWSLRSAFYRSVGARSPAAEKKSGEAAVLDSVDQIRQLSLEEAGKGLPVKFTGVVTWSLPGNDFFFAEDLSGGIRVRFRPDQIETPPRNKYMRIEGVTYNGGFTPAVELQRFQDLGAMETQQVKEITFEQAITGHEDGQLVEMRGFFQRTESTGDFRRIHVTTPAGEFVGLLKSAVSFSPTVGSLIRIRGACEVTVDENGRSSGILLRMGSLASTTIEADAPADFFDLPRRSIKSLPQLNTTSGPMRVRIAGVVLHAVPGQLVYLQEGDVGVLLLTHETMPLAPGDEIEAVGILGREGARTELRETVYRKLRPGLTPMPVALEEPARLSMALDSRLVRIRGTLIDVVGWPEHTRFTLQAGSTLFEAVLDEPPAAVAEAALRVGAGLEVSGLYKIGFDDSQRSRSFQLQLRSTQDIAVFRTARVWTVQRALTVAAVLCACTLLGMGWVVALRRRVHRQTTQIREQLEQQARLEAEVQHAARLESLGVLAGGIAHDFNNILTIVIGNLGLAMIDDKISAATNHHLQEIMRAAARARHLTRQLLTFAKGGDPLLAPVALAGVVKKAVDLTLQGSNARCDFAADSELWDAKVDRDQIAQAVQNLTLNAVQAMPRGGRLVVLLANQTVDAGAKAGLTPGRYVTLTMTDSGEGIAPEVLPRIFDPYFSTRKTGSGLGLATVYSIVNKHQGRIEVESAPKHGTTFHVWLPAAEVGPTTPATTPATSSTPPFAVAGTPVERTARVLFMDDEESIRMIGSIVLRRAGFETVAAADGDAALREFAAARDAGRPFDLLILDLTIPGGMGGKEVIAAIRKIDATVPAIVSSGYSSDPVMANFASFGFQGVVPKPYEVPQLIAVINRLLGRSDAA